MDNVIKIGGKLHRDGNGEINIICRIPKDAFPQLKQGADEAKDAIFEITLNP